MFKKIAIAVISIGLSFGANALSMSESTTIGNTVSTSHGHVKGVERTLSVEDTYNSANLPLGSTSTPTHDEARSTTKYKGTTYGASNTSFTSVKSEGASGGSIGQTSYSGDSMHASNIKYNEKFSASGYADNEFTGIFGDKTEHTEYSSHGQSKTRVHTRTESETSGWELTWGE